MNKLFKCLSLNVKFQQIKFGFTTVNFKVVALQQPPLEFLQRQHSGGASYPTRGSFICDDDGLPLPIVR